MGLLVTVPVFMFLILLIMRKRISVTVDAKNPMAEKDDIDRPARAVITWSFPKYISFIGGSTSMSCFSKFLPIVHAKRFR